MVVEGKIVIWISSASSEPMYFDPEKIYVKISKISKNISELLNKLVPKIQTEIKSSIEEIHHTSHQYLMQQNQTTGQTEINYEKR
jgi:hypothetical protein